LRQPLTKDNLELPTANVRQGDAFELIGGIQPESLDLIITSPPYWGLRTYGLDHNPDVLKEWSAANTSATQPPPYDWYKAHGGVLGMEPYPEWYIAHLAEFFELAKPKLKPAGNVWVNLGDTYFARWSSIREGGRQGLGDNPRIRRKTPMGGFRQEKQLLLIPARFAITMQERKWILRNDLIWYKPNVPPRPEKDRLRLAHEHLFHFVHKPTEGRPKYYYDKRHTEPEDNDVVTVRVRASGHDKHTATFPEQLITPRILSCCPPGGTVLDPFSGTGRVLTVCQRHGRNSIGFELSGDFVKAARLSLGQR
jgi:site-specific DNA-methyltransferase (cytosine-N4-specific)